MKRILTVITVGIMLAGSLYAENTKLDRNLEDKVRKYNSDKSKGKDRGNETVRVILKTLPSLRSAAEFEAIRLGGKERRRFTILSGNVLDLPLSAIEQLLKHPGVHSISMDDLVEAKQNPMTSHVRATTGAKAATETYGATGMGVGIAIIDSGIRNVPDLQNVVKSINFTDDGLGPRSDPYGHGTHVAGLAAGSGVMSNGLYQGIAPNAKLIDVRVLNENGAATTSTVIAGIEWVINNQNAKGDDGQPMNIRVMNLSLGKAPSESMETDPLTMICREAVRRGILVVVSAGNYGKDALGRPLYGTITSPGNEASVLTVGAMTSWNTNVRTDDKLATYSSRGPTFIDKLPKPDIVAPGSNLIAPQSPGNRIATNYPAQIINGNYMKLSGTSMATPVVAGAVALMLEKKPNLKPNGVKAILMYTAEKRAENVMEVGGGYMNVAGALDMAMNINSAASVGSYWLVNNGADLNYSDVIEGSPVVWSQTFLWRDSLSGGNALHYNTQAWSETIVWGETIVWAETIVWGETIVWAETIVWGETIVWAETVVEGESILEEQF
jgi:serine protease AprX